MCIFCAPAAACFISEDPTDSMEPVTVKISEYYFQVPEKYLRYFHVRVPREGTGTFVDDVPDEGVKYTVGIKKHDPHADPINGAFREKLVGDIDVIWMRRSSGNRKVFEYLKNLASTEPPITWAEDIELARKLNLDGEPRCGSPDKELSATYEDLLRASNHRLAAIRAEAARLLGGKKFSSQAGRKKILLDAQTDESPGVRIAALSTLVAILPDDPDVVAHLKNIVGTDENQEVKRWATAKLDMLERKSMGPE